jgi:hypothetical protein
MAVGLGSMDMPVPSVAAWEWLNWKFPRAVHAGETIYARWTLTQKRAPVGGSPTAIVVWRVDVHTADGALCAEGEIGASVVRSAQAAQAREPEPVAAKTPASEPAAAAPSSTAAAPRRGRRRRRPAGDAAKPKAVTPVEAPVPDPPKAAPAAGAERSATGPRRRRRRRSPGSAAARNGDAPAPAAQTEAPSAPPVIAAATSAAPETANPLTRAIRRLRRP